MQQLGLIYALIAYFIWGLFPLFWKQLDHVGNVEIIVHRSLWSAVFMLFVISLKRYWRPVVALITQPKIVGLCALSALILAWNSAIYIYAVNSGFIIETSMGYYINPLVSVLFGGLFFGDRLRKLQWLAIVLAAIGILYLIIQYQKVPVIALILAVSFTCYGVIKKVIRVNVLHGMMIETGLLIVPALIIVLVMTNNGSAHYGDNITTDSLLVIGGVITVVPLIFFSMAAQKVSLSVLGITQYLAPSLQLITGVWVYNEPFDTTRLIAFSFIWLALLIFTGEGIYQQRLHTKK